jgi:hypothetical protein
MELKEVDLGVSLEFCLRNDVLDNNDLSKGYVQVREKGKKKEKKKEKFSFGSAFSKLQ